ncbi:MAG TPA: S8 family serine peptidase [Roseiflexaceae bacterium]|nr:S8 family serine peptidase [Roseiflexaceae bacterium]
MLTYLGKKRLPLLCILALIVGLMASSVSAAPTAVTGGSKLSKHNRELLAEAVAQGKATVTLLIAAKSGTNKTVASGITGLGGTVRYREDDVSYIRAIVPTGKVEAAAALNGVQAVDLDEVIPLEDPRPEGAAGTIPQPAPGAATPNNNPYMPIGDTGASQFMAAHPTWDGRGVTIGIVDLGVDLDHPALQTTSIGERKIVDWVTGTHPFDDDDPTWINMQAQVSGATFTFNGVLYTAPAAGSYRIGLFNERDPRLGGEVGSDVNRDGNPAGSSGIFAVLWNTTSNDVWVDTNQNNSFADELAMTDYKVRYDVNHFGVDNPATAVAERMPFVVQTDGKNKVVNIGIVSGFHGSHVAGIAAGNSLFGGAMSGAAPGAKIVSLRACLFITGCTAHALVEGMIFVAKQSNVDVINMSIGGLPALNDGNNARAAIYNRLIEQYNVQMFISAGNSGPGMNTIGDPSVATNVMSVGAYITDDTYLADYGAQLYEADNLHYFSSRGPREDGGFKPQIVAPGAAVSTTPLWQPGVGLPYALPPGYQLANGTSMASPQAAGAAALLVSAAQQFGAQHQPAQIRQALNSTARYLTSRYQAYEQGNGLINVGAAWDLLKTNIKTISISASVPVNTLLSSFLATPGIGVGINDREGVTAGDSYVRTYTFTRTSGGGGTKTYNLSWVDNDGTFNSAASIALPLNKAVALPVTINPATSGTHSAILNLDDPSTMGIDYQTMNVVIAADHLTAGNNYSVTKTGSLGPGQFKTYFFNVPSGTPAFKVDMTGGGPAGAGAIRFLRWHPWGLGIDSNAVSNCYNGAPGGCTTGSATSRTVTNPQAGVWEVTVDARRNSDAVSAPFSLTASILGASVSPNPDIISSATLGVPVARSYTLTNLLGAFTGRAVGTTLGSAFRATPTIANLAQQTFDVTVTAGSTSLRATIGNPSDPAADLDLYVYNCTTGTCVLVGQSADGDSEESVTIANPAAGLWRILVDGFAVPAGTTTYDYVDVFTNSAFGSVSVTDANALRPAGSSWTVPGSVTANAAPAAGRVLLGNVQVRTDTNILVGSGDVLVQNVVP